MLSETRHRLITEGSSSKYPREQRTRRRPMARANGRSTAVARLSGQLPYPETLSRGKIVKELAKIQKNW